MHVVVLADTHAPRRWRVCPPRVAEHLRTADRILHAGDVCTAAVLAELAEYAPVTAVLGNNDGPDVAEWGAQRTAELDLDGLKVNMVHDSGAAAGRLTRLRRRFPGADLVVFGHSHIPLDESAPGGQDARAADLQPGIAHRPQAPAARHARPARDRRRPPDHGRHRAGHLDKGINKGAHPPAEAVRRAPSQNAASGY